MYFEQNKKGVPLIKPKENKIILIFYASLSWDFGLLPHNDSRVSHTESEHLAFLFHD